MDEEEIKSYMADFASELSLKGKPDVAARIVDAIQVFDSMIAFEASRPPGKKAADALGISGGLLGSTPMTICFNIAVGQNQTIPVNGTAMVPNLAIFAALFLGGSAIISG